jgi:hypothetical protein
VLNLPPDFVVFIGLGIAIPNSFLIEDFYMNGWALLLEFLLLCKEFDEWRIDDDDVVG